MLGHAWVRSTCLLLTQSGHLVAVLRRPNWKLMRKIEQSPLMAAQLKSMADADIRFADGEQNPGLTVGFETR